MGKDKYIDEHLAESIETLQEALNINTFREASRVYDKLARKATLGEIIETHRDEELEESEVDKIRGNLESANERLLEGI
ncbi:MAG: hypothetical protein ABEK04_03525 [Candidatus Nanohalobium sp.]